MASVCDEGNDELGLAESSYMDVKRSLKYMHACFETKLHGLSGITGIMHVGAGLPGATCKITLLAYTGSLGLTVTLTALVIALCH